MYFFIKLFFFAYSENISSNVLDDDRPIKAEHFTRDEFLEKKVGLMEKVRHFEYFQWDWLKQSLGIISYFELQCRLYK